MDIAVQTGITKSTPGKLLLSRSYPTKRDETAFLLMEVHAAAPQAQTFLEECERVVQHALVETDGDAWSRLDGTLKELNGLMKGLLLARSMDEVHAIVAVVEKNGTLHVSHAGRGEAYLLRRGTATQITEYTRGKPVTAFVHISSGSLDAGDSVIASSQRLLRAFTPAQLASLAQRPERLLREVALTLDGEGEVASLAAVHASGPQRMEAARSPRTRELPSRRTARGARRLPSLPSLSSIGVSSYVRQMFDRVLPALTAVGRTAASGIVRVAPRAQGLRDEVVRFLADLRNPQRKKRAHTILLASAVAAFLIIVLVVKLSVSSQRSKTRAELSQLVARINEDIKTAENRRLAGDTDAANEILARADAWAKQVMDNESGLFRVEALDLIDRIRGKREEIQNIVRLSPRVLVNLSTKSSSVSAQGMVGIADGEFIVYDRQNWYHILLNGVDEPKPLAEDGLIIDGAPFARFKSQVFLTTGNSVIELQGSQPVVMKTEDPAGWATGKDIETYMRYLYVLTTDNKIEKYERLNNRYGAGVQYNVNGDLSGAIDMTIDSSVYILREGGIVVKMLRGEAKPFTIRHLPPDALKTATKILKIPDSNFYVLDPAKNRIIMASDGGPNGEATYLKQYVLEGDQIGKLQDFYVDPDESHVYVMDEKRVYVVDLVK